jgi:hypothetical protein
MFLTQSLRFPPTMIADVMESTYTIQINCILLSKGLQCRFCEVKYLTNVEYMINS